MGLRHALDRCLMNTDPPELVKPCWQKEGLRLTLEQENKTSVREVWLRTMCGSEKPAGKLMELFPDCPVFPISRREFPEKPRWKLNLLRSHISKPRNLTKTTGANERASLSFQSAPHFQTPFSHSAVQPLANSPAVYRMPFSLSQLHYSSLSPLSWGVHISIKNHAVIFFY